MRSHSVEWIPVLVRVAVVAVALLLCGGPAAAEDVWRADEPARSAAGDPDQHDRSEATLEGRTREAGRLDDRMAESGDLEGRRATAGDPEATAEASDPDARETGSRRLGDLPESPPHAGPIPFETPSPASWAPSSDPDVLAARERYRRALRRARQAIAEYDEMRDQNHPRGEPRLRIERERDASIEALRKAKEALARLER